MITKNYGLAGGTLDATKHIDRIVESMLTRSEVAARNQAQLEVIAATQPGKRNATQN